MSSLIIDYSFNESNLSNPDGSFASIAANCISTFGPGATVMGVYPNALSMGDTGKVQVGVPAKVLNNTKFCIRILFSINSPVMERQNLAESTALPFAIFVDRGSGNSDFKVVVSVNPTAHGWSGTTTEFFMDLKYNNWYVADLVYDIDTLAVFINGSIASVHAFSKGWIEKTFSSDLFIGIGADGFSHHFNGNIAAFQLHDGIPFDLEAQLDVSRSQPEWFISYKYNQIKTKGLYFGSPTAASYFNDQINSYVQDYNGGVIMFNHNNGVAFEMHGSIYEYYKINSILQTELGYLVSDEGNAGLPESRKTIFRNGGIYWSPYTGAVHVSGQLYLDYEHNDEAKWIGLPISAATDIIDGKEQVFQWARMYFRNGASRAYEVHGAILDKFLSAGGVNNWGYPVSNEADVMKDGASIGKFNDFENCTIYWSPNTGSFEVHGDILKKYKNVKGPAGDLGFPTSDENSTLSTVTPVRYNTFQNGIVLWYGDEQNTIVCKPFNIFLGTIDSKENEGAGMGQNDLQLRATILENGQQLFTKRFPESGHQEGNNIMVINQTLDVLISPIDVSRTIKFKVEVYDADPGTDDHLGTLDYDLSVLNAWGMRDKNGVFANGQNDTGPFQNINNISWAVQPVVNIKDLSEEEKWWGMDNDPTETISYTQYATAFRDVDSEPEWWDIPDWLKEAFYQLVIKGIGKGGNCFGMSLEAINSRKGRSLFSMPLSRFETWEHAVNEFNIHQQYQVGASAICWFVEQVLSGNTHAPVDVFNETKKRFDRGDHPVLNLAQNYTFSGARHAILPVGWDTSMKPWKIKVCDPNFPKSVGELLVDPDENTFSYDGGRNKYHGGRWLGGRMHYMPYTVLNSRPRIPAWDAILLILRGVFFILGEAAETVSLTDDMGTDLDAFSQDAITRLQQGQSLNDKFVPFKGFDNESNQVISSSIYMRYNVGLATGQESSFRKNFNHTFRGLTDGELKYILKDGLSQFMITSSINTAEVNRIGIHDVDTSSTLLDVTTEMSKMMKLEIENKLGVGKDKVKITIDAIPIANQNELKVSMNPGLGSLDIVTTNAAAVSNITISTFIDGTEIHRNYDLNIEGGLRLYPSTVISSGELEVNTIDNVYSEATSSFLLQSN